MSLVSRTSVKESVVRITSTEHGKGDYGTGVVIYRDQKSAYVATCTHVVRDVGGEEKIKIADKVAKVLVSSEETDLSILQVEDLGIQQVRLINAGNEGTRCIIYGCQSFENNSDLYEVRSVHGNLGEEGWLQREGKGIESRTRSWQVRIDDATLDPGYSGSPVVIERNASNYVIAIVSLGRSDRTEGRAISVETLEKIWQRVPSDAFFDDTRPDLFANYLRETGIDYTQLRDYLKEGKWKEADFETAYIMMHRASWQMQLNRSNSYLEKAKELLEEIPKPPFVDGVLEKVKEAGESEFLKYSKLGVERSIKFALAYGSLSSGGDQLTSLKRLRAFPLLDLITINDLWINYSGGRYGFSVQRDIWLKLSRNGEVSDTKVFENFCQRVGWQLEWNLFDHARKIFQIKDLASLKNFTDPSQAKALAEIRTGFKRLMDIEIKSLSKEGCYPFLGIRCFRSRNPFKLNDIYSFLGVDLEQNAKNSAIRTINTLINMLQECGI